MNRTVLAIALVLGALSAAHAQDVYFMPFDVDPPLQVDGDLPDWQGVPNEIALTAPEQVTYRKRAWGGPEDLSGIVHLAWRADGIVLAAEVTDNVVLQPGADAEMWRGDHLMLWLDMTPTAEPERDLPGDGQFQLAISPGNFGGAAGGEGTIAPQAWLYRPEALQAAIGTVAARRTDTGYVVEAYLPVAPMRLSPLVMNRYASFEIAISDSDSATEGQELLMTRGAAPWAIARSRLLPLVFGDGNGQGQPPVASIALADEIVLAQRATAQVTFDAGQLPEGREPFLFLRGRRNSAQVGGYSTKALEVAVNGTVLTDDRLTSGPDTAQMKDGRMLLWVTPDGRLTLPWAPDFTSAQEHPTYGLVDTVAGEYEFYLGGLLREGENVIELRNVCVEISPEKDVLTVGDVALRARPNAPGLGLLRPAPTGELPVIEPRTVFPKTYELVRGDGRAIELSVGDERFVVTSRFSAPDGQWHEGSTPFYAHSREVIEHDEWIEVRDRFRNLTGGNVPVMQEHACALGEAMTGVWLAGSKMPVGAGQRQQSDNPSVFAATAEHGLGMVPLSDVFQVHARQEAAQGTATLADRSFYLAPGAEYAAEWAIVPVTTPDFYDFVNQARRMLEVNFTLKWLFAFHFYLETVYDWSDQTLRDFIVNKSTNFIVKSLYAAGRLPDGGVKRGTLWMESDLQPYRDFHRRVHELFPDGSVNTGIYFHCFLDVDPRNEERFAADRLLTANGEHLAYGEGRNAYMKYYVPTLDNGFGAEMERWLDTIMYDVGVDGVYWDEFAFTRGYAYNMPDGVTADIDPQTMQITRLKGDTALLSRDWRLKQVRRIMGEGRPFIVNGMPRTRTLQREHFEAFTETGNIGNCRNTLLYSPVALGDHLSEITFRDAYKVMLRALDFGCLYVWYSSNVVPPAPTLTEHMFPCTPIELHEGYVIGEERIVTNRSGLFGWGDGSQFQGYVYDREGLATDEYPVMRVERDGRAYAEVRIPEGYSAAIVRAR